MPSSYDTIYEDVPRFVKRSGDNVIAGSNNTVIVLGTDRVNNVESGYGVATKGGKKAGAIYIGVGRQDENISLESDDSYLYLSMKADPEQYAGIKAGSATKARPSVILKSDTVVLAARDSMKIVCGDSTLVMTKSGFVIEGPVKFGSRAVKKLLTETFARVTYMTHTHPIPGGSTGTPVSPPPDTDFAPEIFVE